MIYLDTNYLIRFFTGDNSEHFRVVCETFARADSGNLYFFLMDVVILEALQVLESKNLYQLSKQESSELLIDLINNDWLKTQTTKGQVLNALELYSEFNNLDFVDALLVAGHHESLIQIATFDKKLLKHLK